MSIYYPLNLVFGREELNWWTRYIWFLPLCLYIRYLNHLILPPRAYTWKKGRISLLSWKVCSDCETFGKSESSFKNHKFTASKSFSIFISIQFSSFLDYFLAMMQRMEKSFLMPLLQLICVSALKEREYVISTGKEMGIFLVT